MKIVYNEGILASQVQAARYLGGEPIPVSARSELAYVGTTRENSAALIDPEELYLGEPMSETVGSAEFGCNPVYLACSLAAHIKYTLDGYRGHPGHAIRWWRANCAQDADVAVCLRRYQDCVKSFPFHAVVLWGSSRGAATVFCTLARNPSLRPACVVLEGCYDQLRDVAHACFGTLAGNMLYDMGSYFTAHNPSAPSPMDLVDQFPHDVPVAFVTSDKDELVPRERTVELVAKLRARGHPNVELLILKHSRHDGYATDHPEDKAAYVKFTREFINKFVKDAR